MTGTFEAFLDSVRAGRDPAVGARAPLDVLDAIDGDRHVAAIAEEAAIGEPGGERESRAPAPHVQRAAQEGDHEHPRPVRHCRRSEQSTDRRLGESADDNL
ncbi:hypothetical protein ACU686_09720 [Yinghuangia aomiensis]